MKFLTILVGASFAAVTTAFQRCIVPQAPKELLGNFTQEVVDVTKRGAYGKPRSFIVNTYIHVITTTAKKGKYSKAQIAKQMEIMNDRYRASRFQFKTKKINYVVNDDWAVVATESDLATKGLAAGRALHRGGYQDLNLYLLSDFTLTLGQCFFPKKNPTLDEIKTSGCILYAETMPGGSAVFGENIYNEGLTAVHETGHWLGLFHTFSQPVDGSPPSCTDKGDFVRDTPAQLTETYGCPTGKDTCPGKGVDPINNYMDYSDDFCMTQFTPGQTLRMIYSFAKFRLGR